MELNYTTARNPGPLINRSKKYSLVAPLYLWAGPGKKFADRESRRVPTEQCFKSSGPGKGVNKRLAIYFLVVFKDKYRVIKLTFFGFR